MTTTNNAVSNEGVSADQLNTTDRKVGGTLVAPETNEGDETNIQSAQDDNDSQLTGETPTEGTAGKEDDEDSEIEAESEGKIDVSKVNTIVKSRIEKVRQKTRQQVEQEKQEEIEFWQQRAAQQKVTSDFTLPAKPQIVDYASNPAQYEKDLEAWSLQKANIEQYKNTIQTTYVQRCEQFAKEQPDFNKSVAFFNSVTVPPALEGAILESPNGPKVAYYLAKNFKEFNRISSIQNPVTLVYELAKIELQLTGQVKAGPTAKPVPRPIKTVQGGGAPSKSNPTLEEIAKSGDRQALIDARKKAHQNTGWSTGR